MKRQNRLARLIVLLLCMVIGVLVALQFKNVSEASRAKVADTASVDELRDFVIDLQLANAELAEQNNRLRDNLRALQGEQEGDNVALNQVIAENRQLEIFAGLVAVEGPGAHITIVDGKNAKVDHNHLLTFVNFLRAGNAQGIAINGERLVAMSEILTTGSFPDQQLVINGNIVSSSDGIYTIRVIGDPAQIASTYNLLGSYVSNLLMKGIGVSLEKVETVQLPALGKESPAYRFGLLTAGD